MVLPEKGNTNAMAAYRNDEEQRDLSASLRRKQKIYRELPRDRSGRDGMFGQHFYEAAEKLDKQVSPFLRLFKHSLIISNACNSVCQHQGLDNQSSS